MLVGDPANNLAATSLIRAAITDDADAGVLILREHGGRAGDPAITFMIGLAAVSARALMAAYGYNVDRVMRILDAWTDEYAAAAAQGPDCG